MRQLNRLIVIVAVLGAGLAPALGARAAGDLDEAVRVYRERQDQATPAAVLALLREGNRRFVAGDSTHGGIPTDARERVQVAARGQRPLAAILSCIDSRTAPEMVFDTSVGDLFTARVAANVVNDDVIGSLEIAAASGAKVIVILGHTDCGGIKGACNGLELGHLTQLLERVKPAIASTNARLDADAERSRDIGERIATNRRYVAEVSHANAVQSTEQIRARSPLLREMIDAGEVILVTAVFDVDTGRVVFD